MANSRTIVTASGAPPAIGPYSPAVMIDCGSLRGLLFCSGQVPLDPRSGELVCDEIDGQTERCLQSLQALCEEAGALLSDAVRVTIYTTQLDAFAQINEVYGSFFGVDPPARVTVGVAALPRGAKIEIEAIAAVRSVG